MALIKCPECKKKISDQCVNCPKCGYPIQTSSINNNADNMGSANNIPEKPQSPRDKKSLMILIIAAVVVLVAAVVVCFAVINGSDKGNDDNNIEASGTVGESEKNKTELEETAISDASESETEVQTESQTETQAETEKTKPEFDISKYYGSYTEQSEHSTINIDISFEAPGMFHFYYVITLGYRYPVEISHRIEETSVVDNKVTFEYCDTYGTTGTMTVAFGDGVISTYVENVEFAPKAIYTASGESHAVLVGSSADTIPEAPDIIIPEEPYIEPVNNSKIQYGDICFDNIANQLPISMAQIRQDVIDHEINKFYVDHKKEAFEISHLLPIRGCYTDKYSKDEYVVWLHAYFTNGSITYDMQFELKYQYHDVGGWVYYSKSSTQKRVEIDGTVVEPFVPTGKKSGTFSYDDYPSGLYISMGEIADDILYADLNRVKIDEEINIFDIISIKILEGDYWENEYSDYLELTVRIDYINDKYKGYAEIELDYKYYDAGGWELLRSYYEEEGIRRKFPSATIEFQPKNPIYDDSGFIQSAKAYLNEITASSIVDSVNSNGQTVRTIIYDGLREKSYLKEYYKVTLTATFNGENWSEAFDIALVDADYSDLIGVWEYRIGDEYIRVNIKDVSFRLFGDRWDHNYSSAMITYDYESSAWGLESYSKKDVLSEIEVRMGYFTHGDKRAHMYYNETPLLCIDEYAGFGDYSKHDLTLYIDKNNGVYVHREPSANLGIKEDTFFTKVQ